MLVNRGEQFTIGALADAEDLGQLLLPFLVPALKSQHESEFLALRCCLGNFASVARTANPPP